MALLGVAPGGRVVRRQELVPLMCAGTDVPGLLLSDYLDRDLHQILEGIEEGRNGVELAAGLILRAFWTGYEFRGLVRP